MTNGGAVLSSDGVDQSRRVWQSDRSRMAQRHTCYMDSTPSIIAANAAAVDEAA
jgi:hypothetical protein